MAHHFWISAILALVLTMPTTACAHQGATMKCRVNVDGKAPDGIDISGACPRFVERLGTTQNVVDDITLTVSARGSIRADVIMVDGTTKNITRDVMDRPLRSDDIDALAADVVTILQT